MAAVVMMMTVMVMTTADVDLLDRSNLGLFPSTGRGVQGPAHAIRCKRNTVEGDGLTTASTDFTLGDGDDYLSAGRAFIDGGNGNGGGDDGDDDGGDLQLTGGPRWKRRGGVAGSKTINSGKVDFGHRGVSGIDLSGGSRDGVNFAKGSRVPPRVLPQQPSRHRASVKRQGKKKKSLNHK